MDLVPTHPSLSDEARGWRRLFDHLPALVSFWDRDLHNVVANKAYLEWFGITPGGMRGRHMRDVMGESAFEANLPAVTRALAGKEQYFERTFVTPDGKPRHTLASLIPELVDGDVIGIHVMITDISEQTEARRDLAEAQELARMGSFTYRPKTHEANFSPQLLRIMGHDPEAPSPALQDYLEMVHPDDRIRVDELRARADQGQEYEASYRIVRSDGEVRHLHSRTRRVLDSAGHLVLLRGVMQDETETQRIAAQLHQQNHLLTDLIGVLGHDLRQPISVVNGYLELVDDNWDISPDAQRLAHVRTALRASGRMDSLLTDILTLVNLDTATLVVQPSPLPLRPLVTEIVSETVLPVDIEIPDGLAVQADSVHFRQIMTNLLSNAGRYGRAPYVLTASVDGEHVLIALRDHGEGVPADFVPRLFDRFTRATTGTAATVAGTGFGLYIVRELARANAGEVTYADADPGATFTVRLLAGPDEG